MKSVRITLSGCDDATIFTMDVTDEQLLFLMEVGRRSDLASEYNCQPELWIEVLDADS